MSAHFSGRSSPEAARAGVVVVAGGSGLRMGTGVAKQFLHVGGRPVLEHAIRAFVEHPAIGSVVVVLPAADAQDPPAWLPALGVAVVAGGAERSDSVWNGLHALPDAADPVLVHDGARPFVSAALIDRVLAVAGEQAVIAALPVTDTIKQVDEGGWIEATPDRSRLWQAQTPQGFPRALLMAAHRHARHQGGGATDDATLVERFGARVRVVEGAADNIKITRPIDLVVAEALASQRGRG
jgi:2-C-methyl-D-erythritol 4-phosphate cytidylyltransferase